MKNVINYYYDIYIDNIIKTDHDHYFYLNNEEYHLIKYDRPIEDIKPLYKLNVEMIKRNILVHEIIINKQNQIITPINNENYILLKICNYKNNKVFINDINYIHNNTYNINSDKELYRNDWIKMWCDKIDYYEYQISQLGKKYPILCDSLSYYIGLGENAISYLVNNMKTHKLDSFVVVSHKRVRINGGSFEFYNPMNFIIDSRVRDVSEYIKNSFFENELNLYEIKSYIDKINFSEYEYILLFSRLLFPTYYFDVYDEIINHNLNENNIIKIIEKNEVYEELLSNIYNYIINDKNVFLEPIEWLKKDISIH